jgi:APA family basic amino acid/polyamine antiporter
VPLSLAFGTALVIGIYLLVNVAYLVVLPFGRIQNAPSDRVASALLRAVIPSSGAQLMAVIIMISTFGCMNGMVLAGARAYYAMACDGMFFRRAAALNRAHVPAVALLLQAMWSVVLLSVRTYDASKQAFGNLYSNLLDYVISAALLFYILTIAGVFVLRMRDPNADRPYRAWGYPLVPGVYIAGASFILLVLFAYQPTTTFPGLAIVFLGVPVYFGFKRWNRVRTTERTGVRS